MRFWYPSLISFDRYEVRNRQRWAPDTFFGIRYTIFRYFNAGIQYQYSDTFKNSGVRYSILRYFTKKQKSVIFMRKKAKISIPLVH
jgi:hypothetical protein